MKKLKLISFLGTTILMIAVLSFSAFAASSSSIQDQMAANSSAWWVAYNAGDTATMNSLHQANNSLASQLAGSSGSASYDSSAGTWTISNSSGTTTSSGSSNGKTNTATYSTTSSSGNTSAVSSTSYTDSSINAYMASGGTNEGLASSYNNAASAVTESGEYGDTNATTSAENEVAVAKQLLGLTDAQASALKADLEAAKAEYDAAQRMYNESIASGDTAAAEAAKTAMSAAHDDAQAVRATYNYSGDSSTAEDGGYYYGDGSSGGDSSGGYFTVDITQTYTISASAGTGGSISPPGSQSVAKGGSKVFAITPDSGYRLADVKVDGASVGAVSSYTFSNITSAHTISAEFASSASLSAGTPTLGDGGSGTLKSGNATRSGYGITVSLPVTAEHVEDVTVTASYNFTGTKTVSLQNAGGTWQFPVNSDSVTGARKIYIPVETSDGTYTVSFTVRALDPQATALTGSNVYLTQTRTVAVTIEGSMYQDDATGDS
ncbi:MAG: hypothetical protein GXY20_13055 [Clostridiales bacterium]|nr:hypothetical protein [Clostridiales bacterium]